MSRQSEDRAPSEAPATAAPDILLWGVPGMAFDIFNDNSDEAVRRFRHLIASGRVKISKTGGRLVASRRDLRRQLGLAD